MCQTRMPGKANMDWDNGPRTPRRRDINTVNIRRRFEELQQQRVANDAPVDPNDARNAEEALRVYLEYSRDRHAPIDARIAAIGPDTYRVFRGWELNRNDGLYFRSMLLAQQPEVIAAVYGIDPSQTSSIRMFMYQTRILDDIADSGYPVDRIRELRNLANPNSNDTRLFDSMEHNDPLMRLGV